MYDFFNNKNIYLDSLVYKKTLFKINNIFIIFIKRIFIDILQR